MSGPGNKVPAVHVINIKLEHRSPNVVDLRFGVCQSYHLADTQTRAPT